jgi:3-methyladenine DNA glycosylase Tag
MSELSNAVTVLIARMESHPEDFDVYNGERFSKAKFSGTAEALYGLVGMDPAKAGAYWFLTDADKEALIEAWKKYHRTRMEKDVMETIFDDGEGERELAKVEMQMRQAQMRAQMQNTGGLIGSSYPYTVSTAINPGQIGPAQNAAQNNTGLLGSAANAFSGIFK